MVCRERSRLGHGNVKRGISFLSLLAGGLPVAVAWWAASFDATKEEFLLGTVKAALVVLISCLPILLITWRDFFRPAGSDL